MLSVEDMQMIFDISRNMAYKIVNTNDFPKIRIGSRIFIKDSDFVCCTRDGKHAAITYISENIGRIE